MGVAAQAHGHELVDLRQLTVADLSPLLDEEVEAWRRKLHWDFRTSAEMLKRYLGYRALEGLALMEGHNLIGYCYWVSEGRKALLGDLYVRSGHQGPSAENALLRGALDTLAGWPDLAAPPGLPAAGWVKRVESQLLMLTIHGPQVLPQGPEPQLYRRLYMIGALDLSKQLRAIAPPPGLAYEPWAPEWNRPLARLIHRCYEGHIDGQINDQYRTVAGAGRFLENLTQYPGCGQLLRDACWVLAGDDGEARGMVLSTKVSERTGHVAQLCVDSSIRGSGAAYELMRRSMTAMMDLGCEEASLTVTAANERALAMYQRLGMRAWREFDAFVWQAG